jgi:hypothetical protein
LSTLSRPACGYCMMTAGEDRKRQRRLRRGLL